MRTNSSIEVYLSIKGIMVLRAVVVLVIAAIAEAAAVIVVAVVIQGRR